MVFARQGLLPSGPNCHNYCGTSVLCCPRGGRDKNESVPPPSSQSYTPCFSLLHVLVTTRSQHSPLFAHSSNPAVLFFHAAEFAKNRGKRKRPSGIKAEDEVTRVMGCATMWHESSEEICEMLKSIFRIDEDYSAR